MNEKEKMYVAVIASLLGLLALTTALHSRENRKLREQRSVWTSEQILEKKRAIYLTNNISDTTRMLVTTNTRPANHHQK